MLHLFLQLPDRLVQLIRLLHRLLADGSELSIIENWITQNYPDVVFVSLGEDPRLPDPVDTVIEVTLKA